MGLILFSNKLRFVIMTLSSMVIENPLFITWNILLNVCTTDILTKILWFGQKSINQTYLIIAYCSLDSRSLSNVEPVFSSSSVNLLQFYLFVNKINVGVFLLINYSLVFACMLITKCLVPAIWVIYQTTDKSDM